MSLLSSISVLRTSLVVLVVPVVVLSGCGGSGSDSTDAGGGSGGGGQSGGATASDGATSGAKTVGAAQNACKATVTVTGAATAAWKQTGANVVLRGSKASGDGPDAVYSSATNADMIGVYSSGTGFMSSITLQVGKRVFSTGGQAADGLDAKTDGSRARVDSDVADIDGKVAHVRATFTCSGKALRNPGSSKPHHQKPGTK